MKQIASRLADALGCKVFDLDPSQQGLKLAVNVAELHAVDVFDLDPSQQGLKH